MYMLFPTSSHGPLFLWLLLGMMGSRESSVFSQGTIQQEAKDHVCYEIPPTTDSTKIDQFGYLPDSVKTAVIVLDGNERRSNTVYQLRELSTGNVVLDDLPFTLWNEGATAPLSGDRGGWVDFSSVNATTAGTLYYLYNVDSQRRSHEFEIHTDVYRPILTAACRMFYYNRCGHSKQHPYAENNWTYEGAAFEEQDSRERYYLTPDDASSARNLTGGWFDAGDFNKYVTFANRPVHDLLWAVQENAQAFEGLDLNIPESKDASSDLPDILRELKWELDWLLRMINSDDGSTLLKMGSIAYDQNILVPPDLNTRDARFYAPTCSSASIAAAGMLAHAAVVFGAYESEGKYAAELLHHAKLTWGYALPFLESNTLEADCDDGTVKAGDADWTAGLQRERAIIAAIYLLQATGDTAAYNDYIVQNIDADGGSPITSGYWDYYNIEINDALLLYTKLPEAVPYLVVRIRESVESAVSDNRNGFYGFDPQGDLYRGYLPEYRWGSNREAAPMGILNLFMIRHNATESQELERSMYVRSLDMLHYLHGTNPLGIVYLTNMYNIGGEKCANAMYHSWFAHGSVYDNALVNFGPPPGYLVGGPNEAYTGPLSPPGNQPPQKAYLDFNTGFPDNSWEVTEPSITYQGAYVRLLANFVNTGKDTACATAGDSCLSGRLDDNCNYMEVENAVDKVPGICVTGGQDVSSLEL